MTQVNLNRSIAKVCSRNVAAEYLGVKPQTLAVWHSTGRYPLPVVKVGRRAMYRWADLDQFIADRTVSHGADAAE